MTSVTITHQSAITSKSTGQSKNYRKFINGAFSGALTGLLFQPFDVLRTHQQGAFRVNAIAKSEKIAAISSSELSFSARIRQLWRGTSPTLVRVAGGCGVYFLTLDVFLAQFPQPSSSVMFISGAFARGIAGFIMTPFTTVKARMEWQPTNTMGITSRETMRQVFQSIWAKEGIAGLYRGVLPTLARDIPSSGLYVLIYMRCKPLFEKSTLLPYYGTHFLSGVIAGVVSTAIVQPADVIKTRMQLAIVGTDKKNTLTVMETTKKILVDEGLQGFFKGLGPRVIKKTLAMATTWTLYEYISTSKALSLES